MITVLVTGIAGGALGHELLQALRLCRTPVRIVGADASPFSLGLFEVDAKHRLPHAEQEGYFSALLEICRSEGVQALIPGSESELRVVSRGRALLQEVGVVPLVNASSVVDLGLDKIATMEFLSLHGFAVPRWVALTTPERVAEVDWFPCVVKPASRSSGSNLAFIAQDVPELAFFASYIRRAGYTPMAQEYVGTANDEYTVGVLHSLDGDLLGSIALRRDILNGLSARLRLPARSPNLDHGRILALSSGVSQGTIVEAREVREVCERLAAALGSRGPLNVQLRWVNGVAYPFEINPRFSGTVCLRALAGFNELEVLLRRELLGERFGKVQYQCGMAIRGLTNRFIPQTTTDHSQTGPGHG